MNVLSATRGLRYLPLYACFLVAGSGCGLQDPTDGTVGASIINDSQSSVRISVCEDTSCRTVAAGGETLKPGEKFEQNMSPDTRIPFSEYTVDGLGRQSGSRRCLVLEVGAKVQKSYPISDLHPCS